MGSHNDRSNTHHQAIPMMRDTFQLALLQHKPTPGDIVTNKLRIKKYLATAAEQGTQLLLSPETSLTGYNISLNEARQVAQCADGKIADALASECRQHNIALAYGFIESANGDLYNSVQVINRHGVRVALYRKTHLWGELDRHLFSQGSNLAPVFELDDWQFGLLICYDVEFPETSRRLALEGAEVILVPTALMTPWAFVADHMIRVRAAENQVFIAYANYCGEENDVQYVGRSCIVSPTGEILARGTEEPDILTARLKRSTIEGIRADLSYHPDRRPELYAEISKKQTPNFKN